jgi:hypothetical protein
MDWENFWRVIATARKDIANWTTGRDYYVSYRINLGQRKYKYNYDARLNTHDCKDLRMNTHKITLEFYIDVSQVDTYTEPVGMS